MDILYTGDIPSQYHYAQFNNGYIDLYDTDYMTNGNYTYYRVYTNAGGFFYRVNTRTIGQYTYDTATNITTTDNVCYRFDFVNILTMTLIFTLFGVWLFNIITSIIRKGGLLGGLL